jgi:endogenous inhibitor of DNA gyrase (YacG/DUF329 family)
VLRDQKASVLLPHSCFRCARPLSNGNRSFCSKRCQRLSLTELGTLESPVPWRQYDYGAFDPEDEVYGDYEGNPELASREGYQVHQWRDDGTEDWDIFEERRPEDRPDIVPASTPSTVDQSDGASFRSRTGDAGSLAVDVSLSILMSSHLFSSNGICSNCGRSRQAAEHFKWPCARRPTEVVAYEHQRATTSPAGVEQSAITERDPSDAEVLRLRTILQRIIDRYERERGCRTDPEAAVMLAWAMCSDAQEAFR